MTLWQAQHWSLHVSPGAPAIAAGKVCGWRGMWVNGTQETEPSTRLRLSGMSFVTIFQLDAHTRVKAGGRCASGTVAQPSSSPLCVGGTTMSPQTCWPSAGVQVQPGRRALGFLSPSMGVVEGLCGGMSPRRPGRGW